MQVCTTSTRKKTRKAPLPRSAESPAAAAPHGSCRTQTMMPHCSLALRSRKRLGSLASALTTGSARNTYTGMNTVNRSKCRVPTRMNCSGSTTKKASTRLRWSPRRVGERVMNSRSVKNETRQTAPWPWFRPAPSPPRTLWPWPRRFAAGHAGAGPPSCAPGRRDPRCAFAQAAQRPRARQAPVRRTEPETAPRFAGWW